MKSHPHRAYAVLTSVYLTTLSLFASRDLSRRRIGVRTRWEDLLLLGIATQQVARTLTTDRVAEAIRSPVTEGEAQRTPTGTGMQRALGELVTCKYCVAPWIALGLTATFVRFPVPTRIACE